MILNLLPYCDNWLYDIYDILLNVEKYKYFHVTLTPCKNINKKYLSESLFIFNTRCSRYIFLKVRSNIYGKMKKYFMA